MINNMKKNMCGASEVATIFNEDNLPETLKFAQEAEFEQLLRVFEVYARQKHRLDILDIGIGNARIVQLLYQYQELWQKVGRYVGIDNSEVALQAARQSINGMQLDEVVELFQLDAQNLASLTPPAQGYDLILSTWFTAGNFVPSRFKQSSFNHDLNLSCNDTFSLVFEEAYRQLKVGGELILGSIYRDNEPTRIRQEEAYRHFNWAIYTDSRDAFCGTENGWWSQRFTQESLFGYLPEIAQENFSFIPLDNYEFAWMVRIKKPGVT